MTGKHFVQKIFRLGFWKSDKMLAVRRNKYITWHLLCQMKGENLSKYKINKLQHGKCLVRYLRTRVFCIRELTRSLRSLVFFWYVNNSCVNTVRVHLTWSDIYIYIYIYVYIYIFHYCDILSQAIGDVHTSFDVSFLETEKEYCTPNPCKNSGICTLQQEGYMCSCQPGYRGEICQSKWYIFRNSLTVLNIYCSLVSHLSMLLPSMLSCSFTVPTFIN